MSRKLPISVYIITYNEEANIANCLDSLRSCKEVILVDSGSTDNTTKIASKYKNCKVFHHDWAGFSKQKAFALSKCSEPWVLNLDADETAGPRLLNEIERFIHKPNNPYSGLSVPIVDVILGKKLHRWTKRNAKIRFFRKDYGLYSEQHVHEGVALLGKCKAAKGVIYHHLVLDIARDVDKINQYSSLKAKQKQDKSNKLVIHVAVIVVFPLAFFKSYIWKRNFLNGMYGFVGSVQAGYYAFLKYAKLWAFYRNNVINKQK